MLPPFGRAFATLLGLFFAAADLHASAPRPMTPVDLLSLPLVGSGSLSPDGERLVFLKSTSDWKADKRKSSVWIKNTSGGEPRQLLHQRDDVGLPRWSPDGEWLAFTADGPGSKNNEAYLLPLGGGDAFRLTKHPTSVRGIAWGPEGEWLYYLASEDRPDSKQAGLKQLIRPYDTPAAAELWRVSVPGGKQERVSAGPAHVRDYHVTQHGVLMVRSSGARIDDRHGSSSLWLADLDGTAPRRIASPGSTISQPRLSPEGDKLLYLADVNADGEGYYENNLFVLGVEGDGQPELLLPDLPHEVRGADWGPDGSKILLAVNYGVHTQILELAVESGETRQITQGDHAIRFWDYDRENDSLLMLLRTAASPGELWRQPREAPSEAEQLTHLSDDLSDRFLLPEQKLVRWKAEDGTEVEGLLSLPLDGSPAPHPLVVQSHGGPRSSAQYGVWRWGNYRPVLTARGYAVLTVNYRGSTGYGEDFHRDMVGDYWRHAHTDVLSGVDHLVGEGIADPERLIAMGWSAGGHMTNKLITFTDRFCAASSGAGAVDWVSMYGESDNRHRRTPWFGGAPWEENSPLDAYRKQSPLYEMWKAKTPTIIFVGAEDRRVPRTQSILMVRALEAAGVPTALYVAPNQPHGWSPLRQRLFKINTELEWYQRHAHHRDYEWQEPPEED